jgi:hypothetical protein
MSYDVALSVVNVDDERNLLILKEKKKCEMKEKMIGKRKCFIVEKDKEEIMDGMKLSVMEKGIK